MTTSTDGYNEILIVAAEASSALYAQRLLENWQREGLKIKAFGIGSRAMESLGFEILGRSEELAVVGLQEVLAHFSDIRRVFHSLVDAARVRRPKVALLLDYPDFNLRLAKRLKTLGIPVAYYISPQVWAWRQGRVHQIRRIVDKMLVLFPFERDFYESHGIPVEFVGHPLLDELDDRFFSEEYRKQRRERYGLSESDILLALMPGSRRSELKHHLQLQLDVARRVVTESPRTKVALFVAPTFSMEEVRESLGQINFPVILVKDEPFEMIQLADVVLCASGTATLMVGLLEKPMVIMYRMNPLTAWIAKKFVRSTRHFGLINLVCGQEVVPERFQEEANPAALKDLIMQFVNSAENRRRTASSLRVAKERLGHKGATRRVAQALSEYWNSP